MKRVIYILLILFLLILCTAIFIRPAVICLARWQLRKVFIGSEVSLGRLVLGLRRLSFLDVEIKKEPAYVFKFKEAGLRYQRLPLLKQHTAECFLEDARVSIKMPQRNTLGFKENLELSCRQAVFLLGGLNKGKIHLQEVQYNKVKIKGVESKVRRQGRALFLDNLSAQALGGLIQGDLRLNLDREREYFARLKAVNINLETLVRDFDLQEKFQLTGILEGSLALDGRGDSLNILSGNFNTLLPGGLLVIKDSAYLENIARSSGQSLGIIVESFKNYHYNTGKASLSLEAGNLVLEAALDGEAGRRNLRVVWHGQFNPP